MVNFAMSGLLSLSGTKAANDLKVNVVNTSNINLHETAFKAHLRTTRTVILPLMILPN